MKKNLLLVGLLVFLTFGATLWYLSTNRRLSVPESIADLDMAAKKADSIQSAELQASIIALERNNGNKIIWGDRFLRWTILAYTLWRVDQGDTTIVPEMERLLVLYYNHAWYPNVKNSPQMPFPSLISYFRADGTWEDYWNDYKPVYASAFVLEYYLLASYDHDWGIRNFPILKNVTDSIIAMWLPTRHQPTAYVDAFKVGGVEVVEIKNITSSVDSAMVDSALIAAGQIARTLVKDEKSARVYESYANDSIGHFTSEMWDWFSTNIFGSNPQEDYGTALQLGMTMPNIDGDEKIDQYAQEVNSSLRLSPNSWLLKWRTSDTEPSSRSVYAAIGLAPKYPEMALRILIAYAHKALQENPWFTSKTDGYEAEDPIWVSGKFLEAYVLFKQRTTFGRTVFSPSVLRGELKFETSLAPGRIELQEFNFTFPSLYGGANASVREGDGRLTIAVKGFMERNVTITFTESLSRVGVAPRDVLASSYTDPTRQTITIVLAPDSRQVIITVE